MNNCWKHPPRPRRRSAINIIHGLGMGALFVASMVAGSILGG